jgi:DNA-binding SARP family transcriptional activator
MLQSCRKMSKQQRKVAPYPKRGRKRTGPSGSERVSSTETPRGEKRKAVRVWLLGGFQVSVGSRTITQNTWHLRKAAALVKLLALAPSHRMHREQVLDLLWPEANRRAASNNLRTTLHAARKVLDPAMGARYLASENESLVLSTGGELWVDAEAFEEAARVARHSQEPATYEAALDLYAGELLPTDRYEEWAEEHRRRLQEMYLALLLELARLHQEHADYHSAIEALRRVVWQEPTREEAHAGLMRRYALLGSKGEALAQYGRLEEVLARELGTEPAASSRALREEIAAAASHPKRPHRSAPRPRSQRAPVSTTCPPLGPASSAGSGRSWS